MNIIPPTFFNTLSTIVGTGELSEHAGGMSSAADEVAEVPSGSQATEVLGPFQVHASLGSTTTTRSTSTNEPGNTESEAPQILAGPSVPSPSQRRRVSALRPSRIIKDYPWM